MDLITPEKSNPLAPMEFCINWARQFTGDKTRAAGLEFASLLRTFARELLHDVVL